MSRFIISSVILLVGLILGFYIGYKFSCFAFDSCKDKFSERDQAFLHKIEIIESTLSCEELNMAGLSGPHKKDGVIYYVNVRDNDYHVIGFAMDTIGPLASWTGADRQPCAEPR